MADMFVFLFVQALLFWDILIYCIIGYETPYFVPLPANDFCHYFNLPISFSAKEYLYLEI